MDPQPSGKGFTSFSRYLRVYKRVNKGSTKYLHVASREPLWVPTGSNQFDPVLTSPGRRKEIEVGMENRLPDIASGEFDIFLICCFSLWSLLCMPRQTVSAVRQSDVREKIDLSTLYSATDPVACPTNLRILENRNVIPRSSERQVAV